MENKFKVGGTYCNRSGQYEVVELDEPYMVIRYQDGRQIETTTTLQGRIRGNMQAEQQRRQEVLRASARRKVGTARTGALSRGAKFTGLLPGDFQRGMTGTTWRARPYLGGLLAERLSAATQRAFLSYAIYRRAEVHIVLPERYHNTQKDRARDAKLVFELDVTGARYGFYIEKNNGPMDGAWHWLNMLAALGSDEALQQATSKAMRRQRLQWEVYIAPTLEATALVAAGEGGLEWRGQGNDEAESLSWPQFAERLSAIDADAWCNLYLCARMTKEEGLAASAGIAGPVVEAYRALLPLYDAATTGGAQQG